MCVVSVRLEITMSQKSIKEKPARRVSHRCSTVSIAASDDDNFDDSMDVNTGKNKTRQGKMPYSHEDILIESIMKRFDVVENKTTDKSLCQSNKKRAAEVWKDIQTEFEEKTKVTYLFIV